MRQDASYLKYPLCHIHFDKRLSKIIICEVKFFKMTVVVSSKPNSLQVYMHSDENII